MMPLNACPSQKLIYRAGRTGTHTPNFYTSCNPAVKCLYFAYKRGFKSVASTASRLRKQTRPEGDISKPKIEAITNACLRIVAGGS